MEDVLRTMLLQRLGVSGEQPDTAPGSNGAAPTSSPDPLITALLGSLENSREAPDDEDRHARCRRELQRARRTIRQLGELLEPADQMVHYIGQTFGACTRCWGLNTACPNCRGRGRPGSAAPVEEELLTWVEPALRRLGKRVSTVERSDETSAGAAGGDTNGRMEGAADASHDTRQ